MPRKGNLRCIAPSRLPRACRKFFTVSYTIEGTPTDVMYMIDSRGSSIGRVERSSAGGTCEAVDQRSVSLTARLRGETGRRGSITSRRRRSFLT